MIKQGLPNPEQDAIAKAKQKLIAVNGQWHHAKLIAELNFGFWTNLFKTYYHPVIWQQKQKPIKDVFRESPKISAKQAYSLLNTIRVLRNRIAHHEAIWNKPELYQEYQSILDLLAALGSSLKNIATNLDRFPAVWNSNPG